MVPPKRYVPVLTLVNVNLLENRVFVEVTKWITVG